MIAVFMPNCAARIAATYPPGPEPITIRSYIMSVDHFGVALAPEACCLCFGFCFYFSWGLLVAELLAYGLVPVRDVVLSKVSPGFEEVLVVVPGEVFEVYLPFFVRAHCCRDREVNQIVVAVLMKAGRAAVLFSFSYFFFGGDQVIQYHQ